MKRELNIWDWLFYGSILTILVWLILKIIGVINTPVIIEYGIPIGGALIAFVSFYQQIIDKIITLSADMAAIKVKVDHLDKDMDMVKRKINVC